MATFRPRERTASFVALAVCCLAAAATSPVARGGPMGSLPPIVLWAWERPEDLTAVDPATTAVAVLDRTIRFSEDAARVAYRRQPLKISAGVARIAVIRLEGESATVNARVYAQIVEHAVAAAARPGVRALQIDFDATVSQRELYRQLLHAVRHALPRHTPLSITALASWCADPEWLHALPIDEAVPMAFQMGPDGERIRARLGRGEPFHARACRGSIGLSTDEPVNARGYRRVYVFSPSPWRRPSNISFVARHR